MIFNPADGFVRAVVDVRGVRPNLPLLGGVGEIAVFGAGRDADIAIALRFLHCLPGPFPREHVVGLALAAQQVHRHLLRGKGKADYVLTGGWSRKAAKEAKRSEEHTTERQSPKYHVYH